MTATSGLRRDRGAADSETAEWLAGLRSPSSGAMHARLHELCLRAARAEVSRRAARLRLVGPELDDVAHQAADDAMVAILRKLDTFRGESRFTTWAYRFVILEVSGKVTRHFWAGAVDSIDTDQWERLPDRFGFSPEQAAESADLLHAVRRAADEVLSDRQRAVFVALVVDGIPLDVLTERMGANRNALYQTMFDARRKIRRFLEANGYVEARKDG